MRILIVRLANNLRLIMGIYLASLLLAAVLFSILEHHKFLDSLWWASVTATTVGYGDFAPATTAGRAVAIFFQHLWLYGIVPLILANVVIRVLRDDNQFSHREQEWTMDMLARIAEKLDLKVTPTPADTEYGDVPEEEPETSEASR